MNNFPEDMIMSGYRIIIDKTRLLVAFKTSQTLEKLLDQLQKTRFVLEGYDDNDENRKKIRNERNSLMGPINHTDKRFWIHTRNHEIINNDSFNEIKEIFGNEIDWVGPVYHRPEAFGLEGRICPLPNILLIKFTNSIENLDKNFIESLHSIGLRELPELSKYLGDHHEYIIEDVLENNNAYQIKEKLERDGEFIEEILFESMPLIVPIAMIPNDSFFTQQWNMQTVMAGGNGTTAWNYSTGNSNVVICIIDSGCDLTHPELQGQFATQGVRLDNMTANGSPITPPASANTNIAHGTACAGIAAASFNNSLGVSGMAGGCRLMPLAFVNWTDVELRRGIDFATNNGASIISMSLTFDLTSAAVVDPAIQNAFNNDIVLCAATGNQNMGTITYPARNLLVIAVGASDRLDNRKTPTSPDMENWGSNFGPEISVVAPGVRIPTTDIQGSTGFTTNNFVMNFNGTSSATPLVAGLAGLIRSMNPTFTNQQVRDRIERNADKVGTVPYFNTPGHPNGTWNQVMGHGRINALKTVIDMDNLWIAWKGSGNDNLNAMNPFNPSSKITLSETSDTSPSITAFNNSIWIAWKGSGNDNLNVMDVFVPINKIILSETSDAFPGVAPNPGGLRIAWKGSGNDNLNVMNDPDQIPPGLKTILNETSDSSPSIASIGDFLFIAWKGSGNDNLNVMDVFDPNNKKVLSDTSSHSPSIAAQEGTLFIAWKGSGNDNLNVMNVLNISDPNMIQNKLVLDETSDTAPSLTTFRPSF
jgi:subtilisin family serine protease